MGRARTVERGLQASAYLGQQTTGHARHSCPDASPIAALLQVIVRRRLTGHRLYSALCPVGTSLFQHFVLHPCYESLL